MSMVLPIGYVTILQASDMLEPSIFAGVPDEPVVTTLRQTGLEVGDGAARERTIAEIWKAVDAGMLRAMAIGGNPRRIVRLDSSLTKQIPFLRTPRGRGFTFLRASNQAFHELAGWFGHDLSNITLAFRESDIQKLAHKLKRMRRRTPGSDRTKKRIGRPPRQATVKPIVRKLVEGRKWTSLMGLKALTQQVNRQGKWERPVSADTVTRVLDQLYKETQNRRFERFRRRR
jgi:hypothetical protein